MKDKFSLMSDLSLCNHLSTGIRKRLSKEGLVSLKCITEKFESPSKMRRDLSLRERPYQEIVNSLAYLRDWENVPFAWKEAVWDNRSVAILERGTEIAFGEHQPLMERCFRDMADLNGFLLADYETLSSSFGELTLPERMILHRCLKRMAEYLSETLPLSDSRLSPLWDKYLEAYVSLSLIVEGDRFLGWPLLAEERIFLIEEAYSSCLLKKRLDKSTFLRERGLDDFRALMPYISLERTAFMGLPVWKGHRRVAECLFEIVHELKESYIHWEEAPFSMVVEKAIHSRYDFLSRKERLFARDFRLSFNHEPLFLILYSWITRSTDPLDVAWRLRHGLNGEPKSLGEISATLGKTNAATRTLLLRRGSHFTHGIAERISKANYAFLKEPFLPKEGDYQRVCGEERLPLSYQSFGGLVALTGDWDLVRFGSMVLWVNRSYLKENALSKGLSLDREGLPPSLLSYIKGHLPSIERVGELMYKALLERGRALSLRELIDTVQVELNEEISEWVAITELNRHPKIVRLSHDGMYGLRAWDSPKETVAEWVDRLMEESGGPLTLDEIWNAARERFPRLGRSYLKKVLLKDSLGRFTSLEDGRYGKKREH